MNFLKRDNNDRTPFDVSKMEAEITALPLPRVNFSEAKPIHHNLGEITAEAVRADYEEAAKAITELGLAAAARVQQLDQIRNEADELAKACLDLADRFRAKGEEESRRIEQTHKDNTEARELIEAMARKLDGAAHD